MCVCVARSRLAPLSCNLDRLLLSRSCSGAPQIKDFFLTTFISEILETTGFDRALPLTKLFDLERVTESRFFHL